MSIVIGYKMIDFIGTVCKKEIWRKKVAMLVFNRKKKKKEFNSIWYSFQLPMHFIKVGT